MSWYHHHERVVHKARLLFLAPAVAAMGDVDEFGDSLGDGAKRTCNNPLTKTGTYVVIIAYSILLILATMGITIVIGITTDVFCDCSGSEEAAKVEEEYRQTVNAFSQGYPTNVCYDGTDEDAPHVYGLFTLDGVGAIPRRAIVDGRVCYPDIVPWQALSPSYASPASSSGSGSDSVYEPVWS